MRASCSLLAFGVMVCAGISQSAIAQSQDHATLMGLGDGALVDELTRRYDAGLAVSQDASIIAADDPRYLWALETKVQCAIALGFMESSTRDETSIGNCANAYDRMTQVPQRPVATVIPPPQPPRRRPDQCDDPIAAIVFFDFDSAALLPEAGATLDNVVQNISVCGWSSLSVIGHTDQAGTDQYNVALSQQRADAVATALRGRNVGRTRIDVGARGESNPRVPLPDGTRSPQNRRVEIVAQ